MRHSDRVARCETVLEELDVIVVEGHLGRKVEPTSPGHVRPPEGEKVLSRRAEDPDIL